MQPRFSPYTLPFLAGRARHRSITAIAAVAVVHRRLPRLYHGQVETYTAGQHLPHQFGTGKSLMQLRFFNVNYAAGVQLFEKQLRVLYRAPDHMLAALVEGTDKPPERTAVISPLTWEWLKTCDPHHRFDTGFKDAEQAAAHYYQNVTF